MLPVFPREAWRTERARNHRVLSTALRDIPWVQVLQPECPEQCCPFSGILLFQSERCRAHVQRRIIARHIYPATLWTLEKPVVSGIPIDDQRLSRRMLSIPCDMRYRAEEVALVASLISQFGEEYEQLSMAA